MEPGKDWSDYMFPGYKHYDYEVPPPDPNEKQSYRDLDDYEDRDLTPEERAIYALYEAQVQQSDGFNVGPTPGICDFGQIIPYDLDIEGELEECMVFTKMAIDEFNKSTHKDTEGELVLDKLIMAMGKAANGLLYYLTFDANNLAKGCKITYQAVVLCGIEDEVVSFRRMPLGTTKEDWFWVGHICGGCKKSDAREGEVACR